MFCSRCGKKVLEYMLFCPFCGTEIVIPEQDAAAVEAPAEVPVAAEEESSESVSAAAPEQEEAERFTFEDREAAKDERDAPAEGDGLTPAASDEPTELEELFNQADGGGEGSSEDRDADVEEIDEDAYGRGALRRSAEKTASPRHYRASAIRSERSPEEVSKPAEVRVPQMQRRSAARAEDDARAERAERRAGRAEDSPRRRSDAASARKRAGAGKASKPRSDETGRRTNPSAGAFETKPVKLDDMFMDDIGDDADDYDDYDAFDDSYEATYVSARRRSRSRYDEDDDDEDYDDLGEDADSSFLMRHIRGIVGILLLLVLALVLLFYFLSDAGQTSLAHINATLPLKSEVYARLGRESYQMADYRQAGVYYERALAREPDSYNWASSAVMAYIADENTDKAVEMLKKCIEINPLAAEPYYYLMNLYPDASSRPWEVTQLLQQGYQTTGDARLNVNG